MFSVVIETWVRNEGGVKLGPNRGEDLPSPRALKPIYYQLRRNRISFP